MRNKKRQGFTLVELLFVMAVISIMAGFAIAKINNSTKAATLTSMKNDARNMQNSFTQYLSNKDNPSLRMQHCNEGIQDNNGQCDHTPGLKVRVSKDNRIVFGTTTCSDGKMGYAFNITNKNYFKRNHTLRVGFNSCTHGTIVKTEGL